MSPVRLHLSRLERYVLTRTLVAVGAALAVIAAIIMLVDFVALSRDVGVRAKDTSAAQLFGLTLLQSPSVILMLLPFAFLFGVLAAFVGLNRRSELIAMRAAGISAWRFILPAALAAAAVGVVNVLVLNPVASQMNARFEADKAQLMNGYLAEGPKAVWLRQGDGRTQVIIRADQQLPGDGVRLKQVSLFVYGLDKDGSLRFSRRVDADEARLEPKRWRLINAREGVPGGATLRSAEITVPTTLTPGVALRKVASPAAVPFWSLPEAIARTEKAGFSLRLFRMGGLSSLVASAVGLGFVFFFLNQLCGALGRAEVIPPVLAAWIPALITLLSGASILANTEDG